MAGKSVPILGGCWGGMALTHSIRGMLADEHSIVVVEKSDTFALCLSNLKIMTGEWNRPEDAQRQMSMMARAGIERVHESAVSIDLVAREVRTETQTLKADYLVIALGAELDPAGVPGFAESAYNMYASSGARATKSLGELRRRQDHLSDLPNAIPLPGSPIRGRFPDRFHAPRQRNPGPGGHGHTRAGPRLMAVAGPVIGDALLGMLAEKHITYSGHLVTSIDPVSRTVLFDGDESPFDILVGVPPQQSAAGRDRLGLDRLQRLHPRPPADARCPHRLRKPGYRLLARIRHRRRHDHLGLKDNAEAPSHPRAPSSHPEHRFAARSSRWAAAEADGGSVGAPAGGA